MTDNDARESGATDEEIGKINKWLKHMPDSALVVMQGEASGDPWTLPKLLLDAILARLDAERKRADEAEARLLNDMGEEFADATERIREDGRQAQRRREIWQLVCALDGGHCANPNAGGLTASALINRAKHVHEDFARQMDAEKKEAHDEQ